MPLYEFRCKACQFKFEALKDVGDYKANCPKCGKLANKLMSVANYTFGWRLTERSHERFGPKNEIEPDV